MRPMTRTEARAYGVAISSSRQPLLEAMLCVFTWLVSNVGSMLRTIFNSNTRDWHMGTAQEDQLPTPNDIQEGTVSLSSLDEVGGGGSPRLRGETACRAEAQRRWEGAAAALSSSPPLFSVLSFRAKAHRAADPEPRRQAHNLSSRKPRSGYPGPIAQFTWIDE